MAFERDPNELGSIFVSPGRGQYESTEFFGGKAFTVPDGVYRLENFSGTSGKTGKPYHGIRVTRVDEQDIEAAKVADDPPPGFWDDVAGEKAPF